MEHPTSAVMSARWLPRVGLALGLLLGAAVWWWPLPALSEPAHRLAAVMAVVVAWWVTEAMPLPATALLGMVLAVLLGIAPAGRVLSALGDPVIALFIGSFMLARGMEVHGVDRRIAYALLAHPWVGGRTARTLWMLGLVTCLLSMWVSNTACVAMLFPVVLAMARAAGPSAADGGVAYPRYTTGLLLILSYAAAIGGMATPVGTPPNLIGIALIQNTTGYRINFLQWMCIGVPLAAVLLAVCYGMIRVLFPPEVRVVAGQAAQMATLRQQLGPWTAGARHCVMVFGVAVALWVGPSLLGVILGGSHPLVVVLNERCAEGIVALLAAVLLLMWPVDWRRGEPTLRWVDAVRIDWGIILLFGGGLALGRLMFETGLAAALGEGLVALLPVRGAGALQGLAATTAALISETSSNTASANMVVPVMVSVAQSAGVSGVGVGVAATLGASMGFMLPVSTPPNAIIYSSRAVRLIDMLRGGLLLDLCGVVLVWAAVQWWLPVVLR